MLKWILLSLISFSALATPQSLEVWFLSNAKKAQVMEYLNRPNIVFHKRTAALECQEMGDFCFDPQFGLYKKDDVTFDSVDTDKVVEDKGPVIPTAKSVERDLITCDKNNFFDVFCGKAKAEAAHNIKFDVWIDTSSSMREMDFSDKDGNCFRKSLMTRLDQSCPFNRKVNVMMFDTSIKQAGSMDSLCNNQGLNDSKRLIDWIERSETKKLVIITDISEFSKEFADFIESKNGKFRGDKDPLNASELLSLADELAKSCK